MRGPKIEIYRSFNHHGCRCMTPCSDPRHQEWRWRHRAANGRIIAESGEGYLEPRNLVRGLELSHPGRALVLDEGSWWLSPRTSYEDDIPVTIPEGTDSLWTARRKR